MNNVNIYGVGYIGLPTAVTLAESGYQVLGVDINSTVVDSINIGESHIIEKDLDSRLKSVVLQGKLRASLTPEKADVHIVAVPTPISEDYKPDISYVLDATSSIGKVIKEGDLVIIESTSPIGTTDRVVNMLKELAPKIKFLCAYCPERILPGKMLYELIHNNRVVGGICNESTKAAADFYSTFVKGKIHKTSNVVSELSKITENAFRDVNIAFANELSIICKKLNISTKEIINIVNDHPRVNVLDPGVGVGGHCIAIDPWFLIFDFPKETMLLQSARRVNLAKTDWVKNDIKSHIEKKDKILILGVSYKPNVDDLRESPALEIANYIKRNHNNCLVHDPFFEEFNNLAGGTAENLNEFDKIFILVNHCEFEKFDLKGKYCIDYTEKIFI